MNHLIQKQVLDLNLSSRQQAQQIQEQVRLLYWEQIAPALEQLFSEVVPPDMVIRLDKLEVELGGVSLEKFTDKVLEKVQEQIEERLFKNGFAPGASLDSNQNTFSHSELRDVEVIPTTQSQLKSLIIFLETGLLPWYAQTGGRVSPSTLLRHLLESAPEKLVQQIRRQASPRSIRRLQEQFSLTLIGQLWKAATPSQTTNTEIILKMWREWKTLLEKLPEIAAKVKIPFNQEEGKRAMEQTIRSVFVTATVYPSTTIIPQESAKMIAWILEQTIRRIAPDVQKMTIQLDTFTKTVNQSVPLITDGLRLIQKQKKAFSKAEGQKKSVEPKQPNTATTKASAPREMPTLPSPNAPKSPQKTSTTPRQHQEMTAQTPQGTSHHVQKELETGLFIPNAGLVLLGPFLPPFFKQLGLVKDRTFPSETERERAVLLSQYLITKQTEMAEEALLLNKLLCAWPLEEPLAGSILLTKEEQTESEDLLKSVSKHWKALGKTSNEGLRETFLRREGKLISQDPDYKLLVERKAVDVLLERLPWSIGYIKLPWMNYAIRVEW